MGSIIDDIALAIKTAQIGSRSQIRALVARAVLVRERRGASIAESIKALGPLDKSGSKTSNFINTSTSVVGLPDIKMSLRCAMAIAHIERFPAPTTPDIAIKIIATISPVNLTLIGFTAAYKLMERMDGHDIVANTCTNQLEKLAGGLRIWIGGKNDDTGALDKEVKKVMVERCLSISRRLVGMKDMGYESMSDEDAGEGC